MINFNLLFPFFFIPLFLSAQQEEVHYVQFPECRSMVFGTHWNCFKEDGTYIENITGSNLSVQFSIKDGRHEGDLFIFNDQEVLARGQFKNDNLIGDQLTVIYNGSEEQVALQSAPPSKLFKKHWRCQSGVTESAEDGNYIWIASKRYRLEDGKTLVLR